MTATLQIALGLLAYVCVATAQQQPAAGQTTTSILSERAQRAIFSGGTPNTNTATSPTDYSGSFLLPINTPGGNNANNQNGGLLPAPRLVEDNAARQLQADKNAFPFLATLPNQGSAVFITTLKPCGLILPHVHPRGTEQYIMISGNQTVGISEENGGRQNIVFNATAGQAAVVPQGLVHYNFNNNCRVNVFLQVFNSADAGSLTLSLGLNGLNVTDPTGLAASGFSNVTVPNTRITPVSAFALDPVCLRRCGLPSTGGQFAGITPESAAFIGIPAPSG